MTSQEPAHCKNSVRYPDAAGRGEAWPGDGWTWQGADGQGEARQESGHLRVPGSLSRRGWARRGMARHGAARQGRNLGTLTSAE